MAYNDNSESSQSMANNYQSALVEDEKLVSADDDYIITHYIGVQRGGGAGRGVLQPFA